MSIELFVMINDISIYKTYMLMILGKITTLYSSMMGRPDLRPQLMKVRTKKTRPEPSRKDEILGNLVLSQTSS